MLLLFMHFSCLEMCVHTDMITQQTFWCLSHVWLMLYITNRIGLNRKLTNRNLTSASLGVRFILSSIWGNRGAEMKVFLRSFFKQMIKRRQIDVEATEGKCKDWDLNSHVPAERRVLPLHHWIEEPLTCQVDLYHVYTADQRGILFRPTYCYDSTYRKQIIKNLYIKQMFSKTSCLCCHLTFIPLLYNYIFIWEFYMKQFYILYETYSVTSLQVFLKITISWRLCFNALIII